MPHASPLRQRLFRWLCAVLAAAWFLPAPAQMVGRVRYTEVLEHQVHRTVSLPGTVESSKNSTVAAEVRGLVIAMEVREGDHVRRGQPLARLRTIFFEIQLRAAEGRLKESRSRLELADSKLERAKELFDGDVISQDELDDAYSEFTAWQGRVDQYDAEIAGFKLSIDRCNVRAPFDGVIVAERTEVGEWVVEGGPVIEMVALDQLEIRVETPERYYDLIRPGVGVTVTLDALPGIRVEGRVSGVVPQADAQARSFPVIVTIPNPEGRIGVGMLASVSLPVGETYRALVVPKDAVVRETDGELVYRITGDDTVEPVPIESGQGFGVWVVVRGSVESGQRVVTRGNERLAPGMSVSGELLEYPLP